MKTQKSLKIKCLKIVAFSVTIIMAVFFIGKIIYEHKEAEKGLKEYAILTTGITAQAIAMPVWNFDEDGLYKHLASFEGNSNFCGAYVTDKQGDVIAKSKKAITDDNSLIIEKNIILDNSGIKEKLGVLTLCFSKNHIQQSIMKTIVITLITVCIMLFLILFAVYYSISIITTPLDAIRAALGNVAEHMQKITQPWLNKDDEIGEVAKAFNLMVDDLQQYRSDLIKAKNEAVEANKMKDQFLANMSHEIRTPMNGVIGMVELLLNTELTEKQKKYASTAYKCGQDLIELVNDILDYSKIEAGELQLSPEAFDLHSFLESILAPMEVIAQKNEVRLILEDNTGDTGSVVGDQQRIRQVLINLLGNAIKFSSKGTVTLRASQVGNADGIVKICFEVQDTGIGIPKEKQHLLFQKFAQIDTSTTKKYGGTGLGLAICKSLIEIMGGNIAVESEKGQGSRFWFTLPFELSIQKDNTPQEEGLRILFVGINAANAYTLSGYVDKHSLYHAIANSVSGAIDMLYKAKDSKQPYTTVIVGEEIPETERLTLAQAIKNDSDFKNTDIMFISAFSLGRCWEEYHKAGYSKNLVLPINQNNLLNSLRHTG